jgi:hypothetical protein
MSITKIKAKKENCIYFYNEGWRYGKIIKRYSETSVTVRDCTGSKHRVYLNANKKWIANSNQEFKDQKKLRKGKKNGKIKIKKASGKKRNTIKIKRRVVHNDT